MLTKSSPTETDLSPRRVGRHFRKLACRSDPVGEDLTAGGSTVWSSTPGHDRQALLLSRAVRLGGFVTPAGLYRLYGASAGSTESSGPAQWFCRTQWGRHDVDRTERRPNKGMNLTSALTRFARWHGQRSQVMPGVGRRMKHDGGWA